MAKQTESAGDDSEARFVGFAGKARIAAGALPLVAAAARRELDRDPNAAVLIFDRQTAEVVDLDLRGTEQEVAVRHAQAAVVPAGRGRPKLGVVAREVTLLPRHWEWLASQPGGASVALRKLVETARKSGAGDLRARNAVAYRFMSAMAGDFPGFEDAARALFAGDRAQLEAHTVRWPRDVREEALRFVDGPAVG